MLTGADLIAPRGEVEPALFPGEDLPTLAARLDGYLAAGLARAARTLTVQADLDRASTVYVYYRAARAAHDRMLSSPMTVTSANEGSATFSAEQLRQLEKRAESYLAEFETLIADPLLSAGVLPPLASAAAPLSFVW